MDGSGEGFKSILDGSHYQIKAPRGLISKACRQTTSNYY